MGKTRAELGKRQHPYGKSIYRVPIAHEFNIYEHLGAIQRRRDGRWNWWRWKSKFHKWQTGQGVAASEVGAQLMLLEGWDG